MSNRKLLKHAAVALSLAGIAASATASILIPPASAEAQTLLKARVQEDGLYQRDNGPSLDRGDMQKADPFAQSGDNGADPFQAIDAPPGAWQTPREAAPPLKGRAQGNGPLIGNAQDQGGQFNGVPQNPSFAPMPQPQMPMTPRMAPPPPQQQFPPLTAEEAYEMNLPWDQWHKAVAVAIYTRYNTTVQQMFGNCPPMRAVVTYTVTRDGRIINPRITEKSPNVMYNAMLLTVVQSIAGDPVLQFPAGTHRQTVDKASVFSWSSGHEGFKSIVNDREKIRMQQQQRMMQQGMPFPMR